MTTAAESPGGSMDYLAIEPFLRDALTARVLQAAFEDGLIDHLSHAGEISDDRLSGLLPCDAPGLRFLVEVLTAGHILRRRPTGITLTDEFRRVLPFADLIQTRLQFAAHLAPDYFEHLPALLRSADEFMSRAALFELFDYSRCQEVTPQNCLHAARWMQLTTVLSRYEGPVCCDHYEFSRHRYVVDAGGNSGEFLSQVCRRNSQLRATVADLPAVCEVGRRHLGSQPDSQRIAFQPLDFLQDAFPPGADLITFKSVLHDWPDDLARRLLAKAGRALPADGRILIFERQRWDMSRCPLSYGMLPILLFFRSYRQPEFYVDTLSALGFQDVTMQSIPLEVPFLLVSGRRGPAI